MLCFGGDGGADVGGCQRSPDKTWGCSGETAASRELRHTALYADLRVLVFAVAAKPTPNVSHSIWISGITGTQPGHLTTSEITQFAHIQQVFIQNNHDSLSEQQFG